MRRGSLGDVKGDDHTGGTNTNASDCSSSEHKALGPVRAGLYGRSHNVEGSCEKECDESPKPVTERAGPEGADDTPCL